MDGIKLKDIFIGYADGETEANSQEHNFLDLFYTGNSKYEEICKINSFIISGRKGTGKTILAQYVIHVSNDKYKNLISKYIKLPNDIKEYEFIEKNYSDISEEEYNLFIKYYILRALAAIVINNKVSMRKYFQDDSKVSYFGKIHNYFRYCFSLNKIKKMLEERYQKGNFDFRLVQTEEKNGYNLENEGNLKVAKTRGGASSEVVNKYERRLKKFIEMIREFEKMIFDVVRVNPVLVVFDDIDDINKYIVDYKNQKKFLILFIKCIKEINTELQKCNSLNKCIIIIRDDILNSLNAFDSNLNKTIVDAEVNLDWVGNNQQEMLLDMFFTKISKCSPRFATMPVQKIREEIIAGNKRDIKYKLNYIIDRGFGRPRDVITYFSKIIKNNSDAEKIDFNMIKSAQNEYSSSFWSELKNELSFYYEYEYINAVELFLSSFGKKNFTYAEVEEYYNNHREQYLCINDFNSFMNMLYSFGIVGNFRYESENRGKASFSYRKDGHNKLNIEDKITVHFGLRPVFNL